MLKTAIIGCGKIADSHAEQLRFVANCELVAVCDREELMARQLAERFSVRAHFTDVREMLQSARPDVVHITTPPQSHFELGKICIEHGCHCYIEKPFTTGYERAAELIRLAQALGVKLTVGNDAQFTPAALRFREIARSGYLGAGPMHIESYYCYALQGNYAKALLGDKNHWVRRLPGGLLQNIISHGLVRVAEFFEDQHPLVIAHGFSSKLLVELGESEIIDELRVIISDNRQTTAYFTFSSAGPPCPSPGAAPGFKNGLLLDDDEQSVIKLRGARYKSYAEKFVPPLVFVCQHLENLRRNLSLFARRQFHLKGGMGNLFRLFYESILNNTPLPIPYRDILLTLRIMDEVFEQLSRARIGCNGEPGTPESVEPRRELTLA